MFKVNNKDIFHIPHSSVSIANFEQVNAGWEQKAFKVDETCFKPERAIDRQVYFPKQNSKKQGEISKMPRKSIQRVQRKTDETAIQENKELEKKKVCIR